MTFLTDVDPGDETTENGGSLCVWCREDAAMPNDDLCEDCQAEIIGDVLLERVESAGAYELDDPKHPSFIERFCDLADQMRDRQGEAA